MIVNNTSNFTIKSPDDIKEMKGHMYSELKKINSKSSSFVIPDHVTDNRDKVVYKVGFLIAFYTILYPEYSKTQIYEIMNTEWQVFVGVRQMERHLLKYKESH